MSFYSRNKTKFLNKLNGFKNQLEKAIFGSPTNESAHGALLNPNFFEFKLLSAVYTDWVNNAYKRNEIVAGALNLIINTFMEADIKFTDNDGEEVENSDMQKLFEHINDEQTKIQFFKELLFHLYLGSIAFIEKVKTSRGKVTELGLLRPDKVQVKTSGRGVDYYVYHTGQKDYQLSSDALTFLRFIDPLDRYKGHSPLHSLATRIDTENEATNIKKSMLQNMGAPGTIIEFADPRSDGELRTAARAFKARFSGDNVGKVLAVDGGTKISPFGSSMKELDMEKLMNVDESRILSTLGVPLPVYGSISGQQSSTYDNMRNALRIFWMHTIIPLQRLIEDFINNDKDLTFGFKYKIKFDNSNVAALNQDLEIINATARDNYNAGLITLNEAREDIGVNEIEGGDELKQQFPSFEDEEVEDPIEDEEKMFSLIKRGMNEALLANHKDNKHRDEAENKDEAPKEIEEQRASDEIPTNHRDLLNEYKIATKRFNRADAVAFKLARSIDKELSQQIKDVINIVGPKEGKNLKSFERARIEDAVSALKQEWELRIFSDNLEVMTELIQESAKDASAELGGVFDIENENIAKAIKDTQLKFADQMSKTSIKQVKKTISSAFDEGKTLGELAKDIRALGNGWDEARSFTIARTETARAANTGAKMGYVEAGVTKMQYTAILDDKTTELCKSLDGKIIGVEEKFITQEEGFIDSKGGSWDLSYSDGVAIPPDGHPNCRSTIIPIVE